MAALKKALAEAEDKAAKERAEHEKQEARVNEVQHKLQDFVQKYESLSVTLRLKSPRLLKALQSMQDTKAKAQKALQEIQAAKKIVAGKAFIMQSKHVKETFRLLT